jgi:hypothetical protein
MFHSIDIRKGFHPYNGYVTHFEHVMNDEIHYYENGFLRKHYTMSFLTLNGYEIVTTTFYNDEGVWIKENIESALHIYYIPKDAFIQYKIPVNRLRVFSKYWYIYKERKNYLRIKLNNGILEFNFKNAHRVFRIISGKLYRVKRVKKGNASTKDGRERSGMQNICEVLKPCSPHKIENANLSEKSLSKNRTQGGNEISRIPFMEIPEWLLDAKSHQKVIEIYATLKLQQNVD